MKKIIITNKKKTKKIYKNPPKLLGKSVYQSKEKNITQKDKKNIKKIRILDKKTVNKNKNYNVLKVDSNHKNDINFKVRKFKNIEHFKHLPNTNDIFILSNLSENFNITRG